MKRFINRFFRWLGYIPKSEQQVVKVERVYLNAFDIRHEIRIDQRDLRVPQMAAEAFMEKCKLELEYGLLEKAKEYIEFSYIKSQCDYFDTYAARIFIAKRENKID